MNLSDLSDISPLDLDADMTLDGPENPDQPIGTDEARSSHQQSVDPVLDSAGTDLDSAEVLPHPAMPGLQVARRIILRRRPGRPVFKKNKTKDDQKSNDQPEKTTIKANASEVDATLEDLNEPKTIESFDDLNLPPAIQAAVVASGYTVPSPIQAAIIPPMLAGRDVIAQSQTGSGKTAAFALPVLANLNRKSKPGPQVLVLAPTRELAMQVARSFETYAGQLKGFSVCAIYGGQDYEPQRRALRGGVSVVVGTPGRVIDHIKRGTLQLDQMQCLVLDEADEMLNMGFLEDVEFVLEQCPEKRQIALFSATMPDPIRRIADRYLKDPQTVTIESETMTAESIRQRAILCSPREKVDLLKRVLEAENTEAVLVFTKTKESTVVVAEKLVQAGHAAAALNGDMPQATRQRMIGSLRNGKLDVLVATDVAARGLDVPRISHVINFDLPHDRESYVHRIGRTGRAGRSGEAILFLSPSARGRLHSIERMTRQPIELVEWPSVEQINQNRIEKFKARITDTLAKRDVKFFEELISQYIGESEQPIEKVAAALADISVGGKPFLLKEREAPPSRSERFERRDREDFDRPRSGGPRGGRSREGMQSYRVEVGRVDGVRPGNLVGAIANEAGIESRYIGPIMINHNFTILDLPETISAEAFETLQRTRVMGKPLRISRDSGPPSGGGRRPSGGHAPRGPRSHGGPSHSGSRGPRKGGPGKKAPHKGKRK